MKLTVHVWRQDGENQAGRFEKFARDEVSPDSSFLEMMDGLNEELIESGRNRLHLTTTVVRVFVGPVAWLSIDLPTGTGTDDSSCTSSKTETRSAEPAR